MFIDFKTISQSISLFFLGLLLTACPSETTTTPSSETTPDPAKLEVTPTTLDLKESESATFTVKNTGEADLTWAATSTTAWVKSFSPQSGTLKGGSEVEVTVTLDRSKLGNSGSNRGVLSITASAIENGIKEIAISAFKAVKPNIVLPANPVITRKNMSATVQGNIVSLGSSDVKNYGHVWSRRSEPTIEQAGDSITKAGVRLTPIVFISNLTNLQANTTYYARAYATNEEGTSYSKAVSFKTNGIPTDITLSNTSISEGNSIDATIGLFTSADPDPSDSHTYTLLTGTSDFSISGNTLRASRVFDFDSKNSYSITIQTDDGNGGTFQKDFTITITKAGANQPPNAFTLTSPNNGATDLDQKPTLSWNASIDPNGHTVTYTVFLRANDDSFTDSDKKATNLNATSYVSTTNLNFQTKHYWKVEAVDQLGLKTTSETRFFTVKLNTAPTAPGLVSPAPVGITGIVPNTELKWRKSTDPDGHTVKYDVYLRANDNTFTAADKVTSNQAGNDTTYTPSGQLGSTTYYWRVVAKDDFGGETPSNFNYKTLTLWKGAKTTFTKTNGADPTLAANQDRITDKVWLTRNLDDGGKGGSGGGGLYNAKSEAAYIKRTSPTGTRWALGTIANGIKTLTFQRGLHNLDKPRNLVGQNMVLHLEEEDIYIDLKITNWGRGSGSDTFTYERSTK